MKFSIEWLPHGRNAAAEEAATVARISITIGNQHATDMRIAGQQKIVDHVVAPAYPLAEGIALSWWTLLYGRGRTTRLRVMRSGFALPDISITGIGNGSLEVRCDPYVYQNPPVAFVTKASEFVAIATFEGDTKSFVDTVVKRLRDEKVTDSVLSDRWPAVLDSMAKPEELTFCRAAGALGVDPYTCEDRVAAFIEAASAIFENDDDLHEFLAGMKPETGNAALDWVKETERNIGDWSVLPAIEECRREIAFRRAAKPPWTTGYASARKVRRLLNLPDAHPMGGMQELATRLGNARFRATEQSTSGLRGFSHVLPGKPRAVVAGSRNPATVLFAVTRTLGDAIHFGGAHRSPVTDTVGTYRQQLGRAFAAEFLAPVKSVLDLDSRGEPIDEIAARFGVSDMVIHHQIENRENNLAA